MTGYMEKLETLNENDKDLASSYFNKFSMLDKLFDVVRSKFEFKNPFGNFNSDVCVIIDYEKLDNKIIKLIKKFYEINGQEFNSIYITPYHKTINDKINDKVIYKELEIIAPSRVINFGIDNLNLSSESLTMNKSDFDFFYDCIGDKDKITSDKYKSIKAQFTEMMKYIILGGRQNG